jgi:ethanolamine ammonia-lyase large subunit
MLSYQSTSFHDALVMRQVMGLRAAPEFEVWLREMGVVEPGQALRLAEQLPRSFAYTLQRLEAA